MAGLYIHIPFCRSRCVYCAFHSGVDLSLRRRYVGALCDELRLRTHYLPDEELATIYFGGGTPSLLSPEDFDRIFLAIRRNFRIASNAEITIECNPDDLNELYINELRKFPFNRVSVGIQSFDDEELRFLRRRHSAKQAENAVRLLQNAGFQNISIDLMFGLPNQTQERWKRTLQRALSLDVQHISAYSLTYEGETPLVQMLRDGAIHEIDEEASVALFEMLIDTLSQNGFEQYEISNFSCTGFRSRHNSSYWHGVPYLGIGAAAHSYDGKTRQWNVADTQKYISEIERGSLPLEIENLSCEDRYNEFVFTNLRTREGVDLQLLEKLFGKDKKDYCLRCAKPFIDSEKLLLSNSHLRLSRSGIFVSDGIMSALMFV